MCHPVVVFIVALSVKILLLSYSFELSIFYDRIVTNDMAYSVAENQKIVSLSIGFYTGYKLLIFVSIRNILQDFVCWWEK